MKSPLGAPPFVCGRDACGIAPASPPEFVLLAGSGIARLAARLRRGKSGYAVDTISRVRALDNHYI
jgi:hypothetical protein